MLNKITESNSIPKNEIDLAVEEIKVIKISDTLKNRIIGMLGSIAGQVRADDIMRDLVSSGLINERFRSKWKTLRNSLNNGDRPTSDFQEYINFCESNLVLYYSLVLNLIEYHGQFTDYSTYGYPLIRLNE